jgi:single-stranded-DNA-specific exonuclease
MKLINQRPRLAIESLLAYNNVVRKSDAELSPKNSVFVREITISDLIFIVGPRINAAGRMDVGKNSANLLITNNIEEITALGKYINTHNSERKELDSKTTDEAISMAASELNLREKRSLVMYNPSWSKGIVGIVASRLVEHFYKPSIVLTLFDDMITGSARSVKDFDIHLALSQCSDLLERFGGHTFAAGLSLKPENLTAFTEKFEEIVSSTIPESSIVPSIEIEAEISLNEINMNFFTILKRFSPFGPGNLQPLFITKNVVSTGDARIVGENHLKLSVFQENSRSYPIDAIAFGFGQYYKQIASGQPFHICYHIDINEWQGRTTLQLNIKDIKFENE